MTPEEKRAYSKIWYRKNAAKVIARTRAWAKNHKDKRQAIHKRHYQKRLANEQGKKDRMIEFLGGKCLDCNGVFPPCVYDIHHLDPKQKDFALARARHFAWEKIVKELVKCVLLCANCHRKRHGISEVS